MRTDDSSTRGDPQSSEGASRGAPSHQDPAAKNEALDDWLDAALADTFPASDPIASPPEGQPIPKAPDVGNAINNERWRVEPRRRRSHE